MELLVLGGATEEETVGYGRPLDLSWFSILRNKKKLRNSVEKWHMSHVHEIFVFYIIKY